MTNAEWLQVVQQVKAMKTVQKGTGVIIDVFSDMSLSLAKQLPECDAKTNLLEFYAKAKEHREALMSAVAAHPKK